MTARKAALRRFPLRPCAPVTTPAAAFNYYDIAKPMTYLPAMLLAAPVVANRRWLKSLDPELEAIVQRNRVKRKKHSATGTSTISRGRKLWKKNAGEIITVSPDESKRYIDALSPVAASIYEALLAVAKRYR